MFNDLPSDEAETWAATLIHHSAGVFLSTQTYTAWRGIPSTYVVGERDMSFFSMEIVDMILDTARVMEPTAFDVVERCDGGHCLMISHAEWLADVLRRAAGEKV